MKINIILISSLVIIATTFLASVYALDTVEITVLIKKGTLFSTNYYVQNDKVNFTFGSTNSLCPDNTCNYKFEDGEFADSFFGGKNTKVFKGLLKIEDQGGSSNITSYTNYQMSGAMHLVGTKENKETGKPIIDTYKGDLGFDTEAVAIFPQYSYQSVATYDHTTQTFHLQGRTK